MREVSGGTLHYRRWQIVRLPLKLNANLTEMPSSSVVGRQYTNSLRDEATSIMRMTAGNDDARHGGVNGRKEGRDGRHGVPKKAAEQRPFYQLPSFSFFLFFGEDRRGVIPREKRIFFLFDKIIPPKKTTTVL